MSTDEKIERVREEEEVYFISILVTFFIVFSSSSLTEHLIMSMERSIYYASQCASRFLSLSGEDKEMMMTTYNRVISSSEDKKDSWKRSTIKSKKASMNIDVQGRIDEI